MSAIPEKIQADWDPRSDIVLSDQIKAYDKMRQRCPVAYSDYLGWSLFRHGDVVRALDDYHVFSSAVSSHLSVPSGMDPPRHTAYRRLIERHFEHGRVEAFEPRCRSISANLVSGLKRGVEIDLVTRLAQRFAIRIQCAFLGWPDSLHEPLLAWVRRNHEATLAKDTGAMAAIALEFDGYISELLEARRQSGPAAPDDVTTSLLQEWIDDRRLSHDEIVSILRNWTVGELGTITACVGILAHHLAQNQELQQKLREDLSLLPTAIDEILRLHPPLISNRRVTTRSVEIGGRTLLAFEPQAACGKPVDSLVLSGTRTIVPSGTGGSCYREPKHLLSFGNKSENRALNLESNTESNFEVRQRDVEKLIAKVGATLKSGVRKGKLTHANPGTIAPANTPELPRGKPGGRR